jgi:anaerobic ribonucleoside-triphosphate reductase
MTVDFKQLNEMLSNLNNIRYGSKGYKRVQEKVEHKVDVNYERQGEEGLSYEVYSTPYPELYIRLEVKTDSYGDNEHVSGIQFVEPKEKVIQEFTLIN